jgi:hypothetical protein
MTETQGTTYKAPDAPANETDLPRAKIALERVIIPEDALSHPVSVSTIIPHHFRRRAKFGNGPRHRVCDSYEQRATGWTSPQATWI